MKKTELFYSQEKQALAKKRSEERLHAVKMQEIFDKSPKKLSPTLKKQLTFLRDSTARATLKSIENEQPPSFHFEKTSPISNVPNFGLLRHDEKQKRRLVMESKHGTYHNVAPAVLPVTPVKQKIGTKVFVSPGGKKYVPSGVAIKVDESDLLLIPLKLKPPEPTDFIAPRQLRGVMRPLIPQEYAAYTQVASVKLSYATLARPAGFKKPINNNYAQGGNSANDLAKIQLDDFEKGLIALGLATEEEMQSYLSVFNKIHFEHTHKVASHFGTLKDLEGQKLDPRDRLSTFVAPAALNTEMMLFEKFADFLLYKNYHQHNCKYRESTVEYTCTLVTVPNTTQPMSLSLQIKDFHTGKTFTQNWDKPYEVIQKPASAMYSTLLCLLKASLEDKSLLGSPVVQVDPEENKENNSRPFI